jgi:hypothetical protein
MNFLGRNSRGRLSPHFRPNVAITFCHPYRGTRRPSKNLRHHGKRRTLLQPLGGGGVAKIIEAKSSQRVFGITNIGAAFRATTDFPGFWVSRSFGASPRSVGTETAPCSEDISAFPIGFGFRFTVNCSSKPLAIDPQG